MRQTFLTSQPHRFKSKQGNTYATDSAQEQYDKMTKTPVHQLVLRLGLPPPSQHAGDQHLQHGRHLFVSQLGTSVSGATGVVFALMAIINAFDSCSDMAQEAISAGNLALMMWKVPACLRLPAFSVTAGRIGHRRVWIFIPCTLHAAFRQYGLHSALCHRIQHLDSYRSSRHGLQLRDE